MLLMQYKYGRSSSISSILFMSHGKMEHEFDKWISASELRKGLNLLVGLVVSVGPVLTYGHKFLVLWTETAEISFPQNVWAQP